MAFTGVTNAHGPYYQVLFIEVTCVLKAKQCTDIGYYLDGIIGKGLLLSQNMSYYIYIFWPYLGTKHLGLNAW